MVEKKQTPESEPQEKPEGKVTFTFPDGNVEEVPIDKPMLVYPEGKIHNPRKTIVLHSDGRIEDLGVFATFENLKDKHKTVVKMHNGSPQMTMSAKDAIVFYIEEILDGLYRDSDKVDVTGIYKTDTLPYYAPTAFSKDKATIVELMNSIYADRLKALEQTRNTHIEQIRKLEQDVTERDRKIAAISAKTKSLVETYGQKMNEVKDRLAKSDIANINLDDYIPRVQFETIKEELDKIGDEFIQVQNNFEKTKQNLTTQKSLNATLEQTVIDLNAQMSNMMTPEEVETEKEALQAEYDGVNDRAWASEPKDKTKEGIERYFDIAAIVPNINGYKGIKEGEHVLVKVKNGKDRYFIGKLFFNDTKNYFYLGQGLELTITSGKENLTTQDVVAMLLKDEMVDAPTYARAVENKSGQGVPFMLHKLHDKEIIMESIDSDMVEILKKFNLDKSYKNDFTHGCDSQESAPTAVAEKKLEYAQIFSFYSLILNSAYDAHVTLTPMKPLRSGSIGNVIIKKTILGLANLVNAHPNSPEEVAIWQKSPESSFKNKYVEMEKRFGPDIVRTYSNLSNLPKEEQRVFREYIDQLAVDLVDEDKLKELAKEFDIRQIAKEKASKKHI